MHQEDNFVYGMNKKIYFTAGKNLGYEKQKYFFGEKVFKSVIIIHATYPIHNSKRIVELHVRRKRYIFFNQTLKHVE